MGGCDFRECYDAFCADVSRTFVLFSYQFLPLRFLIAPGLMLGFGVFDRIFLRLRLCFWLLTRAPIVMLIVHIAFVKSF